VFILSFSINCFFLSYGACFYNVFILCCRISSRPIAQVNELVLKPRLFHIFEEIYYYFFGLLSCILFFMTCHGNLASCSTKVLFGRAPRADSVLLCQTFLYWFFEVILLNDLKRLGAENSSLKWFSIVILRVCTKESKRITFSHRNHFSQRITSIENQNQMELYQTGPKWFILDLWI
jgi:hypothetical protein